MKTVTEHLRQHLYKSSGILQDVKLLPPYEKLRETQWCYEFEQFMRNRLMMGAFRYGILRSKDKPTYDHMKAILVKAMLFEKTGNLELLVDIANYAMCEYVEGKHPLKHWGPTDDQGHAEIKQ